jgi:hypothetical protein
MSPCVVISLDFEGRWGVADKLGSGAEAYRTNLEGEPEAVLAMLEFFGREKIAATWATVGALACADWDEYFERAPRQPKYLNTRLGVQKAWRALDPKGSLHFAPDAVRAITTEPGQELASHTFSHIYIQEPGCRVEDVEADSLAVANLFRDRFGRAPTSFVFPRNQVGQIEALKRAGIQRWRLNPSVRYWNAVRSDQQRPWTRGLRLLDDVLVGASRRAPSSEMRASYLVRFPLPEHAWKLHLARIARDARGLRPGEALHLWWHPHNMGADLSRSIRRLSDLIGLVRESAPSDTQFISMEQSDRS